MNASQVMIELLAGGARCRIQGVELNCSDVVAHLRDELKLPHGHLVSVEAHRPVRFEQVVAVFESIKAAGYAHKTGYVMPPNTSLERTREG